jgi:hypothetical protein
MEENMGSRGQAHRGSRVAGVGFGGGIDLEFRECSSAIEINHLHRHLILAS